MLVVGAAVAKGPPNVPLRAFTVEPPVPTMQPVALLPSRPTPDQSSSLIPEVHVKMYGCGTMVAFPLRHPVDPVQTISGAFRTCTSVTLRVSAESGESASMVLPDGTAERRVFGLVTESLLYGNDDREIQYLYWEEVSLSDAVKEMEFSADFALTFAGSESTCVQFDLTHMRALVTKRDQWDFYPIDAISARALRQFVEECQPQL